MRNPGAFLPWIRIQPGGPQTLLDVRQMQLQLEAGTGLAKIVQAREIDDPGARVLDRELQPVGKLSFQAGDSTSSHIASAHMATSMKWQSSGCQVPFNCEDHLAQSVHQCRFPFEDEGADMKPSFQARYPFVNERLIPQAWEDVAVRWKDYGQVT